MALIDVEGASGDVLPYYNFKISARLNPYLINQLILYFSLQIFPLDISIAIPYQLLFDYNE
jgi:hypothetical protein